MAKKGIDQFKDEFRGGARNNLFKIDISFPSGISDRPDGNDLELLVKASSLPQSTVATLEVPFRGRNLKLAGQRTFEPWNITVINDVDFKIRRAFEEWSAAMSNHLYNTSLYSGKGDSGYAGYLQDAQVYQLAHDKGDQVTTYGYNFVGCWPSSVSNIELSSEGENIEEFTVELQYQYWTSGKLNGDTNQAKNAMRIGQ